MVKNNSSDIKPRLNLVPSNDLWILKNISIKYQLLENNTRKGPTIFY